MFSITDQELQVFDAIAGKLPNFEGLLAEFRKDPMLLELFVAKVSICVPNHIKMIGLPFIQMSAAASAARQEDTGSIQYDALPYICCENEVLDLPITKDLAKSSCGFNHVSTARFLCPMKRVEEFKVDPM
jgi:hypothetical protein